MTQRIAVVTGGNAGLGFETCRSLAKQGICVILTARDRAKGLLAVQAFQKQELPVRFYELDVSSATSIEALADFVKKEFGRCDILVNNAGIFPDLVNHDVGILQVSWGRRSRISVRPWRQMRTARFFCASVLFP